MTLNNKILPVALVAALLGGSVGAFVMRPSSNKTDASATTQTSKNLVPTASTASQDNASTVNGQVLSDNGQLASGEGVKGLTNDETEAYRQGFVDGVRALNGGEVAPARTVTQVREVPATRVVYRDRTRTRYARAGSSRQVYYDYERPRSRSFWQKHRDKLTVAMGTGGGALVGGLIGGKKGAAIGALAGAGGSALYTYKLRKRNSRY